MTRSPYVWLCVLAFVGLMIFVRRKLGKAKPWGFKELVKNPGLWNEIALHGWATDQKIDASKGWSDAQIAKAVKSFIFGVKSSAQVPGEERVLQSLGPRTHPVILQILRDESLKEKLVTPTGDNLGPEAPLNRLCSLVEDHPSKELGELLGGYLDEESPKIRQSAAIVIGSTGAAEVIALVKKALLDRDQYVRSFTLIGLSRASSTGRLDERSKQMLSSDLQKLVLEGKNEDSACRLLLAFDNEGAAEFLQSSAVLTSSSKSLHYALQSLSANDILVPRDRLIELLSTLDATDLRYPKDYALGDVLVQLGGHKQEGDRKLLEDFMSNPNREVSRGAAAGLVVLNGLSGFLEKIEKVEKKGGYQALSAGQKLYVDVLELDSEIVNGGFSQYFVNSSGDHWRNALEGLQAMGFDELTKIFREAISRFPNGEPSNNRKLRQKQLARLARRDEDVFDALDTRYYESKESVDVFTARFVIRNANDFR